MTPLLTRSAAMPELLTRAAATFNTTSVNLEARTADVVWSAGGDVLRRDWEGPYLERLSLSPEAVDLSRLNAGGPLVNNHNVYDVRNIFGAVVPGTARVDGRQGTAAVQFSAREDVAGILADVAAGIIRNVSVGYTVEAWQDETDATTGQRIRTAVKWTPIEISLVAIPADPGARVRANPENAMPGIAPPNPNPSANPDGNNQPNPPAPSTRAAVNLEIRSIAGLSGLDQAWIDGQIDAGATVEQARAAAFEAMRARTATPLRTEQVHVLNSHDDPAVRCRQMGEALYARVNPGHTLAEPARRYAELTMVDCAREILRLRGMPATGLSPAAIVTRALHATGDFPILLGETVGRTLRQAYQAAPNVLRTLGRRTSAADFRTRTSVQFSEAPRLEKLSQTGEIKSGSFAEAKETYKLETFARKIGISRQMIVNDDLGAFSDLARKFGQAAVETEAGVLVDLLTANGGMGPIMDKTEANPNGTALFHASHKNLAAAGAAIAEAPLSAAREAMRTQTGLTGELVAVAPRYLVVPPALETVAEKWLTAIQASTAGEVNPFGGKLELVVEARLQAKSPKRWYLAADPAVFDGLEYAYLGGNEGPQINSFQSADVDGVTVSVVHDFGAGFVDWRGWYQNPGPA